VRSSGGSHGRINLVQPMGMARLDRSDCGSGEFSASMDAREFQVEIYFRHGVRLDLM